MRRAKNHGGGKYLKRTETCAVTGKISYRTDDDAKAAAGAQQARDRKRRFTYQCTDCTWYHTTRAAPKRMKSELQKLYEEGKL